MRKVIRKIVRFFKLIGAIFNLLFSRINNRGNKKGVAQVVDSFNSGGLEQVAANLYKVFYDAGYNSSVICISNNVGPMCQQLKSPQNLRIVYYDLIDFINYCAKYNIRTLIFHFSTFHMIFLKMLGFKNYYIIHNTYIWFTEKQWLKLKIKLKFTNGIISVSDWCKNYFEKKTNIKGVKTILNGIDFNNLNSNEKTRYTRSKLKIKNNDIVCLTIGGYTEGKHQMEIIGIMEKLFNINKNIKYVCAGPVLNKKLYNKFKKKVSQSKAKNNIIILEYIAQKEIGDFINEICDIYVQPSIHEAGVPLTVMEALLKGKPVVMTDFMIKKSFPECERIFPVIPPYSNILDLTPSIAAKMSYKTQDRSTDEFVKRIINISQNIDFYKKKDNFKVQDYTFLSLERMADKYLKCIEI